jgi:hypothetical protein
MIDPEGMNGSSEGRILRPRGPPKIWIDVPKWPVGFVHSSPWLIVKSLTKTWTQECRPDGLYSAQQISRKDLVHGGHTRLHVFINVAVEHPHPHVVRHHIRGDELCRQQ